MISLKPICKVVASRNSTPVCLSIITFLAATTPQTGARPRHVITSLALVRADPHSSGRRFQMANRSRAITEVDDSVKSS